VCVSLLLVTKKNNRLIRGSLDPDDSGKLENEIILNFL